MKCILNPDVVLVTVLDESMLVLVGSDSGRNISMRGVNETGVYYWKLLEDNMDVDDIVAKAVTDYEISEEHARKSFTAYLFSLRDAGYLSIEE